MKKSKGDKRREMRPEHRLAIVNALLSFEPSDICKIYSREHFYYNKQFLTLTDLDEEGRSVLDTICKEKEKVKVLSDDYEFDENRNTIVRKADKRAFGCGKFTYKNKKDRKTGNTFVETFIEPSYISDYEIIQHHFNEQENQREIDAFMQKYVFKPYVLGKNVVGVELNFNKEFYVPEKIDKVEDVLAELENLAKKMKGIEV